MSRLTLAVLVAALLCVGCQWPWEPKFGPVTGIVRYPSGAPVPVAKVTASSGGSTFSDATGRYRLEIHASGDSITLRAGDGFDGRVYAETSSGKVTIRLHRSVIVQDIVLDRSDPI